MIKLEKGTAPDILSKHATVWTKELEAEIAAGGDKVAYRKSKYNHPEVKEALINETNRKCAYCESLILHVAYGDIEHIIPKSIDINLTFDWSNLTLACDVCNTKKRDNQGLVDPYEDEPEDKFKFVGPMMWHREGRTKAEMTRILLDLNRIDLLSHRCERLQALENLFERIDQNPDAQERTLILAAIVEHETSATKEYSACARSYLAATGRLKVSLYLTP